MIMPIDAYEELHKNCAMSLLIPKPQSVAGIPNLHNMNFEEAVRHPLMDEHQPSLQNRRRNNNSTVVYGDVSLGERDGDKIKFRSRDTQGNARQVHPWTSFIQRLHETPLPIFFPFT